MFFIYIHNWCFLYPLVLPAETNQRPKAKISLPKNAKRWVLNDKQFVQNSANRRITYRQTGGRHYRGITLNPSQFLEMDKAIVCPSTKYFVCDLGNDTFFGHPRDEVYTLWRQSRKNSKVDTAFFRFNQATWLHYLKEVHKQIKSFLSEDSDE